VTTFQEAFDAAEAEVGGEVNAPEVDPAAEGGQVADGSEVGSEATEPTEFDLAQYGDHVVRVKVDGVEQLVPLKDLPNGYQRQADYTRKTQELAADRQRLQAAETLARAYENDPVRTVKFLAEQQGISLAEAKAQAEAAGEQDESWANEQYHDPRIDGVLSWVEQQREAQELQTAQSELDVELSRLGSLYGEHFDANEVIATALQYQTTDLEGVFKALAFDRMFAQQQAQGDLAARQQAQDAQVTAAKSQLAGTVASGESFAGAGGPASAPITTVAAALEAALADSGFDF